MDKDLKTVVIYDQRSKYLERWKQKPVTVADSRIHTSVLLDVENLIADNCQYANSLLKNTLTLNLEECWPELALCYFYKSNGLLLGFCAERTGEFSYINYLKQHQSKSHLLLECSRVLLMPVYLWKESREELLTLQPVDLLTNNWLQVMSWWMNVNIRQTNKSNGASKTLTKNGINFKNLTETVKKVIFLFDEQQRLEESRKDKDNKEKKGRNVRQKQQRTDRNTFDSSWWQRFFRQTEELSVTLTNLTVSFIASVSTTIAVTPDRFQQSIRETLQNYFKKMGLDRNQSKGTIDFITLKLMDGASDTLSKLYTPIDRIVMLENTLEYVGDNCIIHYAYVTVNEFLCNISNLLSVSALATLFDSNNVNEMAVETVMKNVDAVSQDAKRWVDETLQEGYYFLGYLKHQLLDVRDDYTVNCAKLVSSILSALDVIVRDRTVTDFRSSLAMYNLYAVIMFSVLNSCSKRYIGPSWYTGGVLQDYKQRLYTIMLSLQNELMAYLDSELNLHKNVDYQLSKSRPLKQ